MNTLISLTANKLNITEPKVVYLAFEYAEKMPKTKAHKLQIATTLSQDGITPEVEDFCLDTLSGRATPLTYEKVQKM